MHKQGTASKLQRALTTPRSGTRPLSILNGCRQMLAIALQHAQGRDGRGKKQFVGQRQKLLFDIESQHAEDVSNTFIHGSHTFALPPVSVHRTTGRRHMSQRPLPKTLKLGVRKRKRTFSLGGVCDPVFYFPSAGSRSSEG